MEKMERLRDMLCEELEHMTEQGDITTGSLEIIDKLTHSIKSIDTIMAMEEAEYSNDYRNGSYRNYRYDDGSYDERGYSRRGSYARGSRKRDSRGRYSRMESKERMTEQLEDMMEETTDPSVKQALQKALTHMEG